MRHKSTGRRRPARSCRKGDPRADAEPPLPPCCPDSLADLPGTVFFVPDRWWGFETPGGRDHPGVCIATDGTARATMLKGSTSGVRHIGDRR